MAIRPLRIDARPLVTLALLLAPFLGAGAVHAQDTDAFQWEQLGQQTYASTCSSCHQPEGQGVPGAFPPLAGHVPSLALAEGGREYLMHVVLHGLEGPIEVEGQTYNGLMPPWKGSLSNDQVAAVLNHVLTSWGNADAFEGGFEPFVPSDVAPLREEELTPDEVHGLRQELQLGETSGAADVAEGGSDTSDDGSSEAGAEAAAASLSAGVYTQAQAERGSDLYSSHCAECHGGDLIGSEAGPGLAGPYFDYKWGGRTVAELFAYTSTNMPLDNPGALSDQQYIDIIAHILRANEYPAGDAPLPPDTSYLQQLTIGEEE